MAISSSRLWDRHVTLAGLVLLVHLAVTVVHAAAHLEIPVVGPAPIGLVVVANILLPVVGVGLMWRGWIRLGAATFAASLAVALGLGLSLHFLVPNPDNVAAVRGDAWRLPFRTSAAALVAIDAIGVLLGGWIWWEAGGARHDEHPQSGRIAGVPDTGFRPLARMSYWFARRWVDETPESLSVTAHHRGILTGSNVFELLLDRADRVDDRLTELASLKAASLIGCEFCLDIGTAEARKLGITEEQLRALPDGADSDAFSERERLVLRYAVAMTETPTAVPDELFDELAAAYDEAAIVELTAAIAWENYRGRFNHALGLEAQGFTEGEFCPRPEGVPAAQSSSPGDPSASAR